MKNYRDICVQLIGDLSCAREVVEGWACYASEYFQQKHNLQEDLDWFDFQISNAQSALDQLDSINEGKETCRPERENPSIAETSTGFNN
jgi:hypothetical protein